jgi:GT2 family glycosyltransferase
MSLTSATTRIAASESTNGSDVRRTKLPLVCGYVVTYNGKRFLDECFRTLRDVTDFPNFQLILVDNGSIDGSGNYVREKFPGVDVLRVFPNVGYPHGANQAIDDARRRGADYIVLMNDDIAILHPQWLRHAIAHLEHDPSIGVVAFAEATTDEEKLAPPNSNVVDAEYLSSPVMLMPINLFDRIGVFDEVYYVIADENDLGARAQHAGYRVVNLGVPVYHYGGGTNQTFGRKTAYLQMRNGLRFCLKNRSLLRALARAARMLEIACNPWPATFDRTDAAHCRIRNSGNVAVNFVLWLKAMLWNVAHLPQTLRIRAADRQFIRAAQLANHGSAALAPSSAGAAINQTPQPAYTGEQS